MQSGRNGILRKVNFVPGLFPLRFLAFHFSEDRINLLTRKDSHGFNINYHTH